MPASEEVEIAISYGGYKFGAVVKVHSRPHSVMFDARIGMIRHEVEVPIASAEALHAALGLALDNAKAQRVMPI